MRTHVLPIFPSTCQIFRAGTFPAGPVVYTGKAEKRLSPQTPGPLRIVSLVARCYALRAIYLPPGTDVRGVLQAGGPDIIQWEGNPQWAYQVFDVDDIAAGFLNKFRIAWCDPFLLPAPMP